MLILRRIRKWRRNTTRGYIVWRHDTESMVRSKVWKAITFKAENLYTLVLNFFWQAEVSVPLELLPRNIWDIRSVWTDERAYELPRVFETSACLKHHEANFLLIITSIVSQTVEWNHLQIRARRSRLRHHRDALAAAILPIRIYLVLQRRPLQIFSWLLKALPKPSGLIASKLLLFKGSIP